jgi:type VI secretion system protein ImpA
MAGFDVGVLSSEIAGGNPCGQDLSYDPLFSSLERAVQVGVASSDSLGMDQPAEEPNWRNIRDESFQLLQQSKDLRLGV